MALVNKSKDMTPFDMKRKPALQNPVLLPIIWGASFIMTRQFNLKINKVNMEKIKPPYLVLATHQGFSDYYIGPLSMFPRRAMYVSDMEGFAAFGLGLYRGIGCIGKRRYVADTSVMKNIKYAFSKGQSVFIYPESRHSNIGITARIPDNMGKLVKHFKVSLVILSANGSYLANPFWNEEKTRKVPIKATMELVLTSDMIEETSASDIQALIEERLAYDEYEYQHNEGFLIKDPDRAEGLEKALYRCNSCGTKYKMRTSRTTLYCEACNSKWELSEDGWLVDKDNQKTHLPDWYRHQESIAHREIENNQINKTFKVRVEALPNEKGFIDMGEGNLTINMNEFVLAFNNQTLVFPHKIRESVQTEYNYRNKGKAIVLSTRDCCYYIYSDDSDFEPTELQFMGEYLYYSHSSN